MVVCIVEAHGSNPCLSPTPFPMNTYLIIVSALATTSLVVGASVLAYKTVRAFMRNRLRNQVLREMPPWQRDNWNVTDWHREMMMKLYDTKPEERPIVVSIVKTDKGDGALACCHPKGWGDEQDAYNYAQGAGLEILKTIAGAITLMELRGNKHCLNTLLLLLEQERDQLERTRKPQTT